VAVRELCRPLARRVAVTPATISGEVLPRRSARLPVICAAFQGRTATVPRKGAPTIVIRGGLSCVSGRPCNAVRLAEGGNYRL